MNSYIQVQCHNTENIMRVHVMKLVLIRHGESIWNRENRFAGRANVDLSETGISEASQGNAN